MLHRQMTDDALIGARDTEEIEMVFILSSFLTGMKKLQASIFFVIAFEFFFQSSLINNH